MHTLQYETIAPHCPQVEKEVAKASSLMEGVEGEIGRKKEVSRRVSLFLCCMDVPLMSWMCLPC